MKNFEDILKSFSVRDTLNPKVWENPKDPDKAKMKKKVLKRKQRSFYPMQWDRIDVINKQLYKCFKEQMS